MIGYRDLLLRLPLWFLLTADLSRANIIIGIFVCLLIPKFGPRCYTAPTVIKDWLAITKDILIAIPQAYIEAFEIIFRPHKRERIVFEKSKSRRIPGLLFLEIFLITFTPKTIVVKHHDTGWNEVHRISRRSKR